MTRRTALVIAPGRGAYQADEMGYLKTYHTERSNFIAMLDRLRERQGQMPISILDGEEQFIRSRHTSGENASLLIFGCALADFMAIDRERFDIVGIAGNSMGWYLALTCGGALSIENGAQLVNHMGTLMHGDGVGGQLIYPVTDENWQPCPKRRKVITSAMETTRGEGHAVFSSIELGGSLVLAGDEAGLDRLAGLLPKEGRYPLRLSYHAAFHTPLLDFIVPRAQAALSPTLFAQPDLPLIDGRGQIWTPGGADLSALYHYTLGTQITQTYDFTSSVTVAMREFAPDVVIVLGPGTTMGAPVAQSLIKTGWYELKSKEMFKAMQTTTPRILSMGMPAQRALVTG
ncbi:MAG: ACP S-malonyltransferase [Pseudomonadota bacterium]